MIATLVLSAVVAQAGSFRIDPAASEAGFDLRATMHTVHGATRRVSGSVRAEPDDGGLKMSGRIEIDAASLETGNERRDATMHAKSLMVAAYPSLVFEPERFTPSATPGPGDEMPGALSGKLTIRGVAKPQTIRVTLASRGDRLVVSGTFDVAWAEFGIPDPSFFVVRIESVAHAHFRAEFVHLP